MRRETVPVPCPLSHVRCVRAVTGRPGLRGETGIACAALLILAEVTHLAAPDILRRSYEVSSGHVRWAKVRAKVSRLHREPCAPAAARRISHSPEPLNTGVSTRRLRSSFKRWAWTHTSDVFPDASSEHQAEAGESSLHKRGRGLGPAPPVMRSEARAVLRRYAHVRPETQVQERARSPSPHAAAYRGAYFALRPASRGEASRAASSHAPSPSRRAGR